MDAIKKIPASICWIVISLLVFILPYNASSQINTITKRLREDMISQPFNDTEITGYLNSLNADGSWSDIDYANTSNTNWDPVKHSTRLVRICCAYNNPGSIHYHNTGVKANVVKILDYYISVKPKSANWWYNAIGAPTNLGPALVLMKTGDSFGFDQTTLDLYADQLINYYSESAQKWPYATTGANKIWLLKSSIDKACVKNNEEVLQSNFVSAFEEAKIMTGADEGIKTDYSFYQHGAQLYAGGYGLAFMSDITYFGLLAAETDYRMNDSQLQSVTEALLEGFQWFCQKSGFDYGACGREISRAGATSSTSLKTVVTRLKTMNPQRSAELTDCYNFLNGSADFRNPGNKHFWKSDIMVSHGSNYYLSARIPSKRMYATERMNNENLKRKWLPWGSTNIMVEGDEYRNLFAVWDWSRIPGVTSVLEDVPALPVTGGAYLSSPNEFAGGVSNGVFGLAAYDYSWDGISGRKAYFFTPDAMYCFGSGIKGAKKSPVITNINQCYSSGIVTLKNRGVKSTIDNSELTSSELSWIHHNKVGYLFPSAGEVTVKNMNQTGSWYDINTSQSPTPMTHKVFSAWIAHSTNPDNARYEYIVVPSKSISQFENWINSNPLELIINTSEYQAVYDKISDIYGIVFYNAGNVVLKNKLSVWSDKPCLLLIQNDKYKNSYTISAADPTTKLQNLNIRISLQLIGNGAILNEDKTTSIEITLPSGDFAGSTVTTGYNLKTKSETH